MNKVLLTNYNMKYICIGAHKTGTTSLTKCFTEHNYYVASEKYYYETNYRDLVLDNNDYNYFINLIKNSDYTFFEDSPYNYRNFYKILDKEIPDAFFILTLRNPEEWFNSFIRWEKIHKLNIRLKKDILYLYDKLLLQENKEHIIQKYNQRNNDIIEYFKNKNNFLILNIEASNEEKCHKLKTHIIKHMNNDYIYPHSNRTK